MCAPHDPSVLYLWNLRTLYIGPMFEASDIIPAASSLVVCLDDELVLHLRESNQTVRTRIALLPAGVVFGAETGENRVAMLYLDPVGRDLTLLRHIMTRESGGIYYDSERESAIIDTYKYIFEQMPAPTDTYRLLQEQIFPCPQALDFKHEVDPRVWKTIEYVKSHAMDNLSSESLAERVGMSDAQLRRVFKQTTGIPLRRYRRWHRLFVTATLMASGKTLTDAALAAGFSDSSHFNHTFREMLGMKPSSALRRKDHMNIFIGQENFY